MHSTVSCGSVGDIEVSERTRCLRSACANAQADLSRLVRIKSDTILLQGSVNIDVKERTKI